ncbi:MAG: hypothetical protein KGH53_00460 [Candidatus Micrarchaeota archaeon]|nr:hypothetical protein [Candidatus Micrarchaeota archaeon]
MITVLAIGGNALDNSKNLGNLLEAIYNLSQKGGLIITHGNGPQVGVLANLESESLGVLTAQTEAEMGAFLEEEILKYFKRRGKAAKVETILTRVLVNPGDPSFKSPTKPIGKFLTKSQAQKAMQKYAVRKLVGGYRRVVASPKPVRILNLGSIASLLSKKYIVIAGGGGGIPVFYRRGRFEFADAVIDKDYTSSLIAKSVGAGNLFILTNVDYAYLDFGKKSGRAILQIKPRELSKYLKQNHFEEGSMFPKVSACLDFVRSTRMVAAIGNLKKAKQVIGLKGCTVVRP